MNGATDSVSSRHSKQEALRLDAADPLQHLRSEFIIPTKSELKSKSLQISASKDPEGDKPCIYLCGNSLGLQPQRTASRIQHCLGAWAKKGVLGHFTGHKDSPLAPFLPLDEQAARLIAPIVGAAPDEIAIMETLTANLHLMMASFYRPTNERHKIIIEGRAFPSDHYAVESQIIHHGFDPEEAMILVNPESPDVSFLSTSHILSVIDTYADSTAMILLPGIQYYTGQLFDIETITSHAHSRGLIVGWDLAHAVGNVPLKLHDWDVDFAVWCNYKYMNSGPGSIAGLFVNSKHGEVDSEKGKVAFRERLYGWWGGDKAIRFQMANKFVPIPGAQGYQVGNACSLAVSALIASLEVFGLTDMAMLREKSILLTQFLQDLLLHDLSESFKESPPYRIITPLDSAERGAQLSVQLQPGLLPIVMEVLEEKSVVLDERKPDVIRVAPAPLYNTFEDVWSFCEIFRTACKAAQAAVKPTEGRPVTTNGTDHH